MIVDNLQKSDIQTIGDIKQIKATIDVKNIEFITTLLSSNLYSAPVESFFREIVSNAWDSHVAAGNTNEPVIIKLTGDSVIIRDYGTGLSQEDFEDIYCRIGSSTKRESNDYIGAFGIGKFASLAVSDVVYITDYYNGVAYNYIMIKENGTITTNLLASNPTNEHNGISVKVPIDTINYTSITKALEELTFFPNVYIDSNDSYWKSINNAKRTRYNTFSVSEAIIPNYHTSRKNRVNILLGNVIYPLDTTKIEYLSNDYTFKYALIDLNICIHVNIGEINVTPNREAIIYSESTINVLTQKVKAVQEEINTIISSKGVVNTDDLSEYSRLISQDNYWHPLNDTIDNCKPGIPCEITASYMGIVRSEEFKKVIKYYRASDVPLLKGIHMNGSIYKAHSLKYGISKLTNMYNNHFIALDFDRNITGYTKYYILNHNKCWNRAIIKLATKEEFIRELRRLSIWNSSKILLPDEEWAFTTIYDYVMNNATIITLKEVEDYRKYLKDNNIVEKKIVDTSKYSLHELDYSCGNISDSIITREPISFDAIIKLLQTKGKCVILCGKNRTEEENEKAKILFHSGYKIFWGSTKLYDNILKYKMSITNKKHLSNLELDYDKVIQNPSVSTELKIVAGRYYYQNEEFARIADRLYYCFNTLPEVKRPSYKNEDAYIHLGNCRYYEHYSVKSVRARALEDYFEKITPIINMYSKLNDLFGDAGISGYSTNNIILYKIFKSIIKSKNVSELSCNTYYRLLTSPTIKLLYNE